MKKNALLGVFALLFAVGTAFATTKTQVWKTVYYYQDEINMTGCTNDFLDIDCDIEGVGCTYETTSDGAHQLYELPGCNKPLEQNQGF
ncbi:DUF6520 family protein [Pedobacter chitinilyticus]|uniref:Uncharacterized protein n=1 Tax=Pedobacter chitinilyticus TaxID=2233776 RepID=A0A3S3SUV6_9SPHI|nr:DUF6520 family protein [Pedobacter chitinilyticus]RWU08146.1 hypothetical protein DPV69_07130 [Pedobacter chitinilyticus]